MAKISETMNMNNIQEKSGFGGGWASSFDNKRLETVGQRNPRMAVATSYMNANPYYSRQAWYNKQYDQGNKYTNAAARSGVINAGGYKAIQTRAQAMSSPAAHSRDHAGSPPPAVHGRGRGGISYSGLRLRTSGDIWRSTGWQGLLTQSSGPNKAMDTGASGRGQSSADSTKAVYSTEETRMGTRAAFTDEVWNEAKGKFGQMWTGFRGLENTGGTPHLDAELGQMYVRTNPNVGFARRVKRGLQGGA